MTIHPKAEKYTFFSSAQGTFSGIEHILGHRSNLGKFKKTEIVSSIFSNHNTMRLEINYRKKTVKNTNTQRLNSALLNNQEITEELKGEIKKYLETNDNNSKHSLLLKRTCRNVYGTITLIITLNNSFSLSQPVFYSVKRRKSYPFNKDQMELFI